MALTRVVSGGRPKVTREEVTDRPRGCLWKEASKERGHQGQRIRGWGGGVGGAWRIPGMTDFRYSGFENTFSLWF